MYFVCIWWKFYIDIDAIDDNKYYYYYMAQSYKDWELPNSRIWLAGIDIDRDLDFPI